MARPRTAVGTYGSPNYVTLPSGRIQVEVRLRAVDGRIRKVKSTGRSKAEALRRLKVKLSEQTTAPARASTALTADALFPDLVDAWLQSLDDVGHGRPHKNGPRSGDARGRRGSRTSTRASHFLRNHGRKRGSAPHVADS